MTPRWEFQVDEIAQNSFRYARHLFSCMSNQNQKRSIQEVSVIAEDAVNGFKKLLKLLDGSMQQPDGKRIRRGPLPNSHNINPIQFMDSPVSSTRNYVYNSNQIQRFRHLIPVHSVRSNGSFIPHNGLYAQTNSVDSVKLLNHSLQQHHHKNMIHHSHSTSDEPSILSSKSKTSIACVASNCSRRR